ELPLAEVHAEPSWNCRQRPYSPGEIEEAKAYYDEQPMLHPPVVAQREGRWWLVSGFLRFTVWQAQGRAHGLFRCVEGTDLELLALNLAENIGRRDLYGYEVADRVVMLREAGLGPKELAQLFQRSERWIRRLVFIKRHAHPELWALFCQAPPYLTLSRMLDLVDQPQDKQVTIARRIAAADAKAEELARGFPNDPNTPAAAKGKRARRRYPRRNATQRLLRIIEGDASLAADYRQGAADALRWMLFDTDLSARFSAASMVRHASPPTAAPAKAPHDGAR
ncbi:MAG: hypothetical protein K8H88_19665, partial [Sandaracinaceae bacterium]|nr:hypothetical protein [Sandaracinaceae bacterium]